MEWRTLRTVHPTSSLGPTIGSVKPCLRFLDGIGPKSSEILVEQRTFFCSFSFMSQAHCSFLPRMIPQIEKTNGSHSPRAVTSSASHTVFSWAILILTIIYLFPILPSYKCNYHIPLAHFIKMVFLSHRSGKSENQREERWNVRVRIKQGEITLSFWEMNLGGLGGVC